MHIQAWEDWAAIEASLGEDLLVLESQFEREDSQTLRRSYCRAVFAHAEAVASCMKKYVIEAYYPGTLGAEEKKALDSRDGALVSIFRAFDLFTNAAGAMTPLIEGSAEWYTLQSAIKIRNRVTHPSGAVDVSISDGDLAQIKGVRALLIEMVIKVLESSAYALFRSAERYRIASDALQR
jgi:hypothetical protein